MARSGKYIRQLTGYRAFIPSKLPPRPTLTISTKLEKKLTQAMELLATLNGLTEVLPNLDLLISMYVKKAALLSAQIEGTQASLEDLLAYEQGKVPQNIDDVEEVVNYIKALKYGLRRLTKLPMSVRLIKEMHAILMQGARGAGKHPGEVRRSQNWIGPPGSTLTDARFVPPPSQEAKEALGDLERYMHSSKQHPLVTCALIHYQFETIHPFLDGNGRLGRLLITLFLSWKEVLSQPLLYLSYYLKRNKQEYFDRLEWVREKGDYEQWVEFFVDGIIEMAKLTVADTKKILALREKDHRKLGSKQSSALAFQALDFLVVAPIVQVKDVQKRLSVSYQSASKILEQLERHGIVQEVTGQKRNRRYVYMAYLKILVAGTKPL